MNVDFPKPESEMTGEEKSVLVIDAIAMGLQGLVDDLEANGVEWITMRELRGIIQDLLSEDSE